MGAVAGLGAQGGKGKYHNPVEPIVIVDREQLFEDLAQEEVGAAAEGDVEMAAAATAEDAVAPAAGQEDAEAARKREKKEKKRAKAEGASPKKKKVKTDA